MAAGVSDTTDESQWQPAPLERLNRMLERRLRKAPYPLGVNLVRRVAAPFVRLATRAEDWAAEFEAHAPLQTLSLIRRRLLTTVLGRPRLVALARSRWPDDGSPWFATEGLENLEAARAGGRRIVLANSHYGAPQCVPLMLARLGYRFHSVECCDPFGPLEIERPTTLTVIPTSRNFLARVAVEARRALLDEGMIAIAADGYVGASGPTLPFHGRARRFAAGFAELAVAADAVVVPVLASIDDRGWSTLRIFEALDDTDISAPRPERVAALIRQYAGWLERRWSEDPGNIFNIERFAALPAWPLRQTDLRDGTTECSSSGARSSAA